MLLARSLRARSLTLSPSDHSHPVLRDSRLGGHPAYDYQFPNNVTNCVEDFVDIPHTAFVHPRIFRVRKDEKLTANVQRTERFRHCAIPS